MVSILEPLRKGAYRQSCVAGIHWEWRDPLFWPSWLKRCVGLTLLGTGVVAGAAFVYWQQYQDWQLLAHMRRQASTQEQLARHERALYIRLMSALPHLRRSRAQLEESLGDAAVVVERITALVHEYRLHIDQLVPAPAVGVTRLALLVSGTEAALMRLVLRIPRLQATHITAFELERTTSGKSSVWLELEWQVSPSSDSRGIQQDEMAIIPPPVVIRELLENQKGIDAQAAALSQRWAPQSPPLAPVQGNPVAPRVALVDLVFRGVLAHHGEWLALVQDPAGNVFEVREGDRLGQEGRQVGPLTPQGVDVIQATRQVRDTAGAIRAMPDPQPSLGAGHGEIGP